KPLECWRSPALGTCALGSARRITHYCAQGHRVARRARPDPPHARRGQLHHATLRGPALAAIEFQRNASAAWFRTELAVAFARNPAREPRRGDPAWTFAGC